MVSETITPRILVRSHTGGDARIANVPVRILDTNETIHLGVGKESIMVRYSHAGVEKENNSIQVVELVIVYPHGRRFSCSGPGVDAIKHDHTVRIIDCR